MCPSGRVASICLSSGQVLIESHLLSNEGAERISSEYACFPGIKYETGLNQRKSRAVTSFPRRNLRKTEATLETLLAGYKIK